MVWDEDELRETFPYRNSKPRTIEQEFNSDMKTIGLWFLGIVIVLVFCFFFKVLP